MVASRGVHYDSAFARPSVRAGTHCIARVNLVRSIPTIPEGEAHVHQSPRVAILFIFALLDTTNGGECTSNAQCSDGNACTQDLCQEGTCVYVPGTGCGACCPLLDACEITTASLCAAAPRRGTFYGVGATCEPGFCDVPCCVADDLCVEVTRRECLATLFGQPGVLGETCDDVDCGPTGACCFYASCMTRDATGCTLSEGVFRGSDSTCSSADACDAPCCFGRGDCETLSADTCAVENGGFNAFDLECAACNFAGACCLPTGECVIEWQNNCTSYLDGTFLGPGVGCEPDPCACSSDDECQDGRVENGEEFCYDGFCRSLDHPDLRFFIGCLAGPAALPPLGCEVVDFRFPRDGFITLRDFAVFLNSRSH